MAAAHNGNSHTVYDAANKDCSEPSVTPENSVAGSGKNGLRKLMANSEMSKYQPMVELAGMCSSCLGQKLRQLVQRIDRDNTETA